jgi:hypothetical protein
LYRYTECLECSREILGRADWVTIVGNSVKPPNLVNDPDMPHLDMRRQLWRDLAREAGRRHAALLASLWWGAAQVKSA